MPTQGRQGVLSLPRAWTSPVFYTTGPRRGEVTRKASQHKTKQNIVFRKLCFASCVSRDVHQLYIKCAPLRGMRVSFCAKRV